MIASTASGAGSKRQTWKEMTMPCEKVCATIPVPLDCNGQLPASMCEWGILQVVIACLFC
jgi:hypothetical protein